MQRRRLLLAAICLAIGAACGEKNADELCALADQVAADSEVDADRRGMEWLLRAHEANRDPRLSEALEQMAEAGQLDREVVEATVSEVLGHQWRCPALDRVIPTSS